VKILVVGSRGFPNIQGGIEKHCEELYKRIKLLDTKLDIVVTAPKENITSDSWNGIKFKGVTCSKSNSLEKLSLGFKSLIYALNYKPDVVHLHGIGVGLFAPFFSLCGIKVVITIHSLDYLYPKWGRVAKLILKLSAWCALKAHHIVCVSQEHYKHFSKIHSSVTFIPNGIDVSDNNTLKEVSVHNCCFDRDKVILSVGRITPEKRFDLLIRAFNQLKGANYKLLVVGAIDDKDYGNKIKVLAESNINIIFLGFKNREELNYLYKNCHFFVLASDFEAAPIVPLEAISLGGSVLLSDISANTSLGLPKNNYFIKGSLDSLTDKINQFLKSTKHESSIPTNLTSSLFEKYNWQKSALSLFETLLKTSKYNL
jgi:glycosyltransferase involved in cell wall biosynthesis